METPDETAQGGLQDAEEFAESIVKATTGDGSYAGARKLYLARGLAMTLIERLRAVEGMAKTAEFLREASERKRGAG